MWLEPFRGLRIVGCCVLCGIVTWNICCTAWATGARPVALTYDAPPDCPGEDWVLERISALVRRRPLAPITAKATITRYSGGYRLELSVEEGRQRIVAESCDSLVQTLTVILALAIDPQARDSAQLQNEPRRSDADERTVNNTPVATNGAPASSTSTLPPAARAVVPPVPVPIPGDRLRLLPSPSPAAVRPASNAIAQVKDQQNPAKGGKAPESGSTDENQNHPNLELHPTLLLLTEYGMLPHISHGPSLGLWIDKGIVSLALTAEWLMPAWTQMPDPNQSRGGHISFLGGEAELCMAVLPSAAIRTCAGVEAGDMLGKGSGVLDNRLGQGIWLAGIGEIGLRPKIWSGMSADLRLGLAIPVKRPAFGFEGYNWRYVPQPWSVRLMSGFSWF